jgi:nitroreductase
MPDAARPEVMEFLLSRRSRPAKLLGPPGPDSAALRVLLTAAARAPDHGKLEPWRFIVLEGAALARLAALTRRLGAARGRESDKEASAFEGAPVCVAVIASPKESEKVPALDQTLSAGAVCLGLLNAALASGWGANWLSGWMATDRAFLGEGLGLADNEWVAGFVHIGTARAAPPERPRPDLDAIATWVRE